MLEIILREKLSKRIPVISVISIMGTTEESAVDPLVDILSIRKKLSKEVLQPFLSDFYCICKTDLTERTFSFLSNLPFLIKRTKSQNSSMQLMNRTCWR